METPVEGGLAGDHPQYSKNETAKQGNTHRQNMKPVRKRGYKQTTPITHKQATSIAHPQDVVNDKKGTEVAASASVICCGEHCD